MKTFAYNQFQNGKHVVEYTKASKNMKKMRRRLYKSKLQKIMNKIRDNHFQELIKFKSAWKSLHLTNYKMEKLQQTRSKL